MNFNLQQLNEIGRIKDGQFDIFDLPAALAYILMAFAMAFYVFPSLTNEKPIWQIFAFGAGMGAVIYGIYDLTNLALLKNYPLPFAIADMMWGTFVYGTVACLNRWILN